jgi:hypothetical protein
MSKLEELLADYARLRNGEADVNEKSRDRLVKAVRKERDKLVAKVQSLAIRRIARTELKGKMSEPTSAQLANWPNGFEPRFVLVTLGSATVKVTGERIDFQMSHDGVPFPFYSGLRLWAEYELADIVYQGEAWLVS